MQYWLLKTEPEEWSWKQQVKSANEGAEWSGVRNFQASKNLKNMKKKELKKLTKDQAIKNIDKLKKDLFNFRFQKVNSQITNPSKINETKKTIARLKTLLKGKLNA